MSLPRLSEDEVKKHMYHLPGWTRESSKLVKKYSFRDFVAALQFVNLIGEAAEAVNHHPDIDIRYNKVVVALTSWDTGGITLNDVNLAVAADSFADGIPQSVVQN